MAEPTLKEIDERLQRIEALLARAVSAGPIEGKGAPRLMDCVEAERILSSGDVEGALRERSRRIREQRRRRKS